MPTNNMYVRRIQNPRSWQSFLAIYSVKVLYSLGFATMGKRTETEKRPQYICKKCHRDCSHGRFKFDGIRKKPVFSFSEPFSATPLVIRGWAKFSMG